MRWGFGKRAATRRDTTVSAPQPPARPAVSDWRRVPPLGLTVASRPVLVGATLGSPVVSGTRQLLARSHKEGERADSTPAVAGEEAFTGRVAGLLVPSAPAEATPGDSAGLAASDAGSAQTPAERGSELPPRAHWRPAARTAASAQRQVLVQATDEYVGEPRPQDTPYASSAWLRMIQGYRRLPTEADAAGSESLPGLTGSAKSDGGTVTTWSSSVTFAPPRPAQAQAGADQAAGRPRKLSLAESRRLGIGPPLRRPVGDADDDATETMAGDQEAPAGAPGERGAESRELSGQGELLHGAGTPTEVPAGITDAVSGPAARQTDPVREQPRPEHLGLGFPVRVQGYPPDGKLPGSRPGHAVPGDRAPRDAGQRPVAPARDLTGRAPQHPQPRQPGQLPPGQLPPGQSGQLPPGHWRSAAAQSPSAPLPRALEALQHPAPGSAAAGPPRSSPSGSPDVEAVPGGTDGGARAAAGVTGLGHAADDSVAELPGTPAVVAPVYRPAAALPSPAAATSASATVRSPAGVAAEPLVHRSPPAQPAATDAPPTPSSSPPVVPQLPEAAVEAPAAPPAFPVLPPASDSAPSVPLTGAHAADHVGWPSVGPAASGAAGQAGAAGQGEVTAVPYDLADTLRRLHGIDVSDVAVSRGPDAGFRARALGARAFTSGAEVVLPDEEGPIERPQTRALLAHELTHAAQQRALGPSLPAEDSVYGAELEAQAAAVERRVLGHGLGVAPAAPQLLQHAWPASTAAWPPSAGPVIAAPVQRHPEDSADASLGSFAVPPQGSAGPEAQAATSATGSEADGEGAEADSAKRLLDLNDHQAVSEFITGIPDNSEFISGMYENSEFISGMYENSEFISGIYRKVQARLRRELLVGRERSGLLSDFR
jgi:Domain of unknown function (DUF4157)